MFEYPGFRTAGPFHTTWHQKKQLVFFQILQRIRGYQGNDDDDNGDTQPTDDGPVGQVKDKTITETVDPNFWHGEDLPEDAWRSSLNINQFAWGSQSLGP